MKKIKTIAIGLIPLLFLTACLGKDAINDWTRNELKGKVKTLIQTGKSKNNGTTTKFLDMYDNKGNWLKRQSYRSDGSLWTEMTITYNIKTNTHHINRYNEKGSVISEWLFKYDENGNTIEERGHNVKNGKFEFKNTYQYNEKNHRSEMNSYNSKDQLEFRLSYRTDGNGNIIEQTNYDAKNKQIAKIAFKYLDYDEQGNWTQKQVLLAKDNKPQLIIKRQFTYYE